MPAIVDIHRQAAQGAGLDFEPHRLKKDVLPVPEKKGFGNRNCRKNMKSRHGDSGHEDA